MSSSERIITQLPLTELWTEKGNLTVFRKQNLKIEAIRELLKQESVQFVIANAGDKLKWIPVSNCYELWKNEIKNHIIDNFKCINLDNYPNSFAYLASLWTGETDSPIILLEKHH